MKKKRPKKEESIVHHYYHKISRILEYYILFCFVMIMILPLFDYGWVAPVVRFIYFTGFPLLLLLLVVSLFKEPLLNVLANRYATSNKSVKTDSGNSEGKA